MMHKPYEMIGGFEHGGILIIADHASNVVPDDIDLGIDDVLLSKHIAVDIGVKAVAELIVSQFTVSAIMATQSRLVVDLNRGEDDPSMIPDNSDGHIIMGNRISPQQRTERIERFHRPYHEKIEQILHDMQPCLILSLHSFTNILQDDPDVHRPWDIGILYGEHESTSKCAITLLQEYGLNVGDQLPYSGKLLNYTMDRHAETLNIPYFGVEMRQDLVVNQQDHERFAQILGRVCLKITKILA